METDLEDFIVKTNAELAEEQERLTQEVAFWKHIKELGLPLKINSWDEDTEYRHVRIVTRDYSIADDVQINGSLSVGSNDSYYIHFTHTITVPEEAPQYIFPFDRELKNEVIIYCRHPDWENHKNIACTDILERHRPGLFSGEQLHVYHMYPHSTNDLCSFYSELGVKKEVVEKLDNELRTLREKYPPGWREPCKGKCKRVHL
ncbi:MAG: hypothetical protein HY363_01160 [Candidatus Aenigmarchaeota archaeon]|nr:hypothetical protein [Candidatus Aenigmarchaeota archaeon]